MGIMHCIFAHYFEAFKREQENRTIASGDKIHLLKIVTNVKKKKKNLALGQVRAQITCTDKKMSAVF